MNIITVLDEGRLIRRDWSRTDDQGRQLLCLYTALAGDPEARPSTCPAHLAPEWLAHLLPWMDNGSEAAWEAMVRRVAGLAPYLSTLPGEVEWRVRALCVREAMRHTDDTYALAVCDRVAMLCERRGRGETIPDEELEDAEAAARAAAWAASTGSARAAAWAAAVVAEATVWAAVKAAAWAAEAARAGEEEAVDRLTTAILDEIDRSVVR